MSAIPKNIYPYAEQRPQPNTGRPTQGVYQGYQPSDAERRLWQDWAALILGFAIASSPWLLGFTGLTGATMNSVIIGFLVSALAALSLTLLDRWEAWINLGLGFWLCLSPWLLGYGFFPLPAWAHSLMGLALAVLAISAILRGLREAP